MADSLPALEAERSHILRQISSLADLRPGSICPVALRCGKPTCHVRSPAIRGTIRSCASLGKWMAKTVAESFA